MRLPLIQISWVDIDLIEYLFKKEEICCLGEVPKESPDHEKATFEEILMHSGKITVDGNVVSDPLPSERTGRRFIRATVLRKRPWQFWFRD